MSCRLEPIVRQVFPVLLTLSLSPKPHNPDDADSVDDDTGEDDGPKRRSWSRTTSSSSSSTAASSASSHNKPQTFLLATSLYHLAQRQIGC